jgi:hypothetical protein
MFVLNQLEPLVKKEMLKYHHRSAHSTRTIRYVVAVAIIVLERSETAVISAVTVQTIMNGKVVLAKMIIVIIVVNMIVNHAAMFRQYLK